MYDRLLKLLSETQGDLDFSGPDKEAAKKAAGAKARRIGILKAKGKTSARVEDPEGISTEPSRAEGKPKKDYKEAQATDPKN